MIEEEVISRVKYLQQETHFKVDSYTLIQQAIKELMPKDCFEDRARIFDITIDEAKQDFERSILRKII